MLKRERLGRPANPPYFTKAVRENHLDLGENRKKSRSGRSGGSDMLSYGGMRLT